MWLASFRNSSRAVLGSTAGTRRTVIQVLRRLVVENRRIGGFKIMARNFLVFIVWLVSSQYARGEEGVIRDIWIEVYYEPAAETTKELKSVLTGLVAEKQGLVSKEVDVTSELGATKLAELKKVYKTNLELPIIHTCGQAVSIAKKGPIMKSVIIDLIRMDVFTATGCDACRSVPNLVSKMQAEYPALAITSLNTSEEPNRDYLWKLSSYFGVQANSVRLPTVSLCNRLVDCSMGELNASEKLRKTMIDWTVAREVK